MLAPFPRPLPAWDPAAARRVDSVIALQARLTLLTPASFGDDPAHSLDIPLLRDPETGLPLLRGSSFIGPLRHALLLAQFGTRQRIPPPSSPARRHSWAALLCGGEPGDRAGFPSPLVPQGDFILVDAVASETRTLTAIDAYTVAARDESLRSHELVPAGTTFDLRLIMEAGPDTVPPDTLAYLTGKTGGATGPEISLRRALAAALKAISDGTVRFGARTTRGLGLAQLSDISICRYDLLHEAGLLAFALMTTSPGVLPDLTNGVERKTRLSVAEATAWLCDGQLPLPDRRSWVRLQASFDLWTSLLVAEPTPGGVEPDARALRGSHGAQGEVRYLLPGTGTAGGLRARTHRMAPESDGLDGLTRAQRLFGFALSDRAEEGQVQARRSRIQVAETPVAGGTTDLVQARIAVDRFTAGTEDQKLFVQQPILSYPPGLAEATRTARVCLCLEVLAADLESGAGDEAAGGARTPTPDGSDADEATTLRADTRVLLMLLKDLWLRDLPLGGGAGAGRGRLSGRSAMLMVRTPTDDGRDVIREWRIDARGDHLHVGGPSYEGLPGAQGLERFAAAFTPRASTDRAVAPSTGDVADTAGSSSPSDS